MPWTSRWSAAAFSHTATVGRKVSVSASWNDDASTTSTAASDGDRVGEREADVAGGHGLHARRHQHLGDERGHRGLAVGAGDGDERPVGPLRRQLELTPHGDAAGRPRARTRGGRRARRGWARPGRRRDQTARASVGVGRLHQLDAELDRGGARLVAGPVVDHDDVATPSAGEARVSPPCRSRRARPRAPAASVGRSRRQEVGVEDADRRARCTAPRGSRSARSPSSPASPELEVVVDRRHAEHPAVEDAERDDLDDHRQRDHDEQPADDRQQQLGVGGRARARRGRRPWPARPCRP